MSSVWPMAAGARPATAALSRRFVSASPFDGSGARSRRGGTPARARPGDLYRHRHRLLRQAARVTGDCGGRVLRGRIIRSRQMRMIRQIAEYYRPWKGLFWLDFGSSVLSGLMEIAFPGDQAVHRRAAAARRPDADGGCGGRAGADLRVQRRAHGDRDLRGPHAGHQHRDRDAPPGLRPAAAAVVLVFRQGAPASWWRA